MNVIRIINVSDEEDYILKSKAESNIANKKEYIITIPDEKIVPPATTKKVVLELDGIIISLVDHRTNEFVKSDNLKDIQKSNCGVRVLRVIFNSDDRSFKIIK